MSSDVDRKVSMSSCNRNVLTTINNNAVATQEHTMSSVPASPHRAHADSSTAGNRRSDTFEARGAMGAMMVASSMAAAAAASTGARSPMLDARVSAVNTKKVSAKGMLGRHRHKHAVAVDTAAMNHHISESVSDCIFLCLLATMSSVGD